MLSRDLEVTVRRCVAGAARRRHERATLEHLLLALTEDEEGAAVLDACAVDGAQLRTDLERFLGGLPTAAETTSAVEPTPAEEFSRVIQRAGIHVQSAGRKEITGANVLVAMFSERGIPAVALLEAQGMSRLDAVNFIAHGLRKPSQAPVPAAAEPVPHAAVQPAAAGGEEAGRGSTLAGLLRRLPRGVVLALRPGRVAALEGGLADLELLVTIARRDATWALRTAEAADALAGLGAHQPGAALAVVLAAMREGSGPDEAEPAGRFAPPVLHFRHARRGRDGRLRLAVRVEADRPVAAVLAALWLLRTGRTTAAEAALEAELSGLLGGDPGRLAPLLRAFLAHPVRITPGDGRMAVVLPGGGA